MRCKHKPAILITIVLLTIAFFSTSSSADLGPKSSADFHITEQGQDITDENIEAELLVCREDIREERWDDIIPQLKITQYDPDKGCTWQPSYIFKQPCHDSRCSFGYLLPDEYRLAVYLEGSERQSCLKL